MQRAEPIIVPCCFSLKISATSLGKAIFLAVQLMSPVIWAQQSSDAVFSNFSETRLVQLQESAEKLSSEGLMPEAASVYGELFLAIRANQGLYTEQQFLVLERMISVDIDRKDWDSVNRHLSYHEWLSTRLYNKNPLKLSEQLLISSRYRQRAASHLHGPQRSWHLVQGRTQLWRAVSAIENTTADDGRLPYLWHQIANYHYALTNDSQRWLTSFEARSDEPAMISGWALSGNEVEQRSYEIGSELLQRIPDYYKQQPIPSDIDDHALNAKLLAYQGDWELLFNHPQRAEGFYHQALELTSLSSCPSELQTWLFGRDVVLPVHSFDAASASCEQIKTRLQLLADPSALTADTADVSLSNLYGQQKLRPQWRGGDWLAGSSLANVGNDNLEKIDD
jgi:hypothetical protein